MSPSVLFSIAGASAALAAFAGWRGALPPNPMKGPRMIPWRFLMVLGAAAAIATLFTGLQAAGYGPAGR
jgi:hypothetical protein